MFRQILATLLILSASAWADVKTQTIDYSDGGTKLQGYLAYDDAVQGKRPGILICHEWWGLTDYPKHRAEQLAKLGYVAFALDMYGTGITANNAPDATRLSSPFDQDRQLVRTRALAGLNVLTQQPQVDQTKIAAIGYCFGGMVALELARAGTPLSGVVTFHGALGTPHPEQDQAISAKILVCTGADDAFVPPDAVKAFEDEMKADNADYQINVYSHAVHAFTNPDADKFGLKNIAYNAEADRRSWEAMVNFFNEIFANSARASGR
jgi:dienelactone hydrolase